MAKAKVSLGDILGGFTSMLVALPSAIAFGLVVFSPLGPNYLGMGALAGILGTIALGLISPLFGGSQKLITAPCAPAAAVMGALATELLKPGLISLSPENVLVAFTLVAISSAVLQFLFGVIGGGKIIKYIPYPVIAGYLSGVGIIIIIGQLPKLLGLSKEIPLSQGLFNFNSWNTNAVIIGATAALVMVIAPKVTRALPAPIFSLLSGLIVYFLLSQKNIELQSLVQNPLIIGDINQNADFFDSLMMRWDSITHFPFDIITKLAMPTVTLAVLLSIDTLKTCVIVDALTKSRHNSNRELIGQGLGNFFSALIGGMPGAGTMGATLVNVNSGGKTKLSGFLVGVFSIIVFVALGKLIAWVPLSALAAILVVVGFRMIDLSTFRLLKDKTTMFDFLVVVSVVLTAVFFNLMAATGVGIALAILMFVRHQIQTSVVRRKTFGNKNSSKKRRLPAEMQVLDSKGSLIAIFELQGSLFFGTTDQLLNELEKQIRTCKYIILDMKRVQSIDFTAAHLFNQIVTQIADFNGILIFTNLPQTLPTGQDLRTYLGHVGPFRTQKHVRIFANLDEAQEWAEDQIIEYENVNKTVKPEELLLDLKEIEVFSTLTEDTINDLTPCVQQKHFKCGEKIFKLGEYDDSLYFIRRGEVKVILPLGGGRYYHLASFGRGDFFGEMAFLDQGQRSADAIADTNVDLFIISKKEFDKLSQTHHRLSGLLYQSLAHTLALRLRKTDSELRALEEA